MNLILEESEFRSFSDLIFRYTGIRMSEKKKNLIASRLSRRIRTHNCRSYREYLEILKEDKTGEEKHVFINLVTTHVTHFFRESDHFTFLAKTLQERENPPSKIWSAASSTGEEAYTSAMILQDYLGSGNWSVLGTDICSESITKAKAAFYPLDGVEQIPEYYLKHYCLKGKDEFDGTFTFTRDIRSRVHFEVMNLMTFNELPQRFSPDIVFLRNVLIYFEQSEKQSIVDKIESILSPGSILIIGHSESLNGIRNNLKLVQTSIYKKV